MVNPNPKRNVVMTDREPPENALVPITKALFDNIEKLQRSDIMFALKAFSNAKSNYRLHYKWLMRDTGYSKPQAMQVLRKLANKKILIKIGHGTYIPNMRGEKIYVYRWEIEHANGCTQSQLRVWGKLKLLGSVDANATRFAKKIHMHRTAILRALNDRKDGRGLIGIGLVILHEGKWYTPTSLPKGVTASIPTQAAESAEPVDRYIVPRARRLTPSVLCSTFNIFRTVRTKIKLKNSFFKALNRVAGYRHRRETCPTQSSVRFNGKPIGDSLTVQSIGEDLKDSMTIENFINRIPILKYNGEKIRSLFKEFKHLSRLVIIEAVKNALRWAVTKVPEMTYVMPLLKKWLGNQGNIAAAKNFVRKRFGYSFLDPNAPTTLEEQLEKVNEKMEVCAVQTFENLDCGEEGKLFA